MNDTKRIELENRERWIIDQNSIKQYDRGNGDYTKERQKHYDNMTVDDIADAIFKSKEK